MKLAERTLSAKASVTLALNARAKAMAEQGRDVVSLAAGEPDFNTPAAICEAAIAAIRSGKTKYTATRGTPELIRAIIGKFEKENGLSYRPDQILVSNGAKHTLYNAFQALFEPGDEVIIFSPCWVSYPDMVRLCGATPVLVETRSEDGFVARPEALRAKLTPKTKAVVFNSPCNPTGAVWSGEVLESLGQELVNHPCAIITDDIYEHLVYRGTFHNVAQRVPALVDRTLVVNGVSKTFAMTGWRIGYCAGPRELVDGMSRIQDNSTSCPNSIAQQAALAALTLPKDDLATMKAEFDRRRQLIVAGLRAIPGITTTEPAGAFYVLPDIRAWIGKRYRGRALTDSMMVAEALLTDYEMAVVPGDAFGAIDHLRLSFAASTPMLEKGLERLRRFGAELS